MLVLGEVAMTDRRVLVAVGVLIAVWLALRVFVARRPVVGRRDAGPARVDAVTASSTQPDAGYAGPYDERRPARRRYVGCVVSRGNWRLAKPTPMTQEMLSKNMGYLGRYLVDGLDLSGKSLARHQPAGWQFHGATLVGSSFAGTDLHGAIFLETKAERASFVGSDAHILFADQGTSFDRANFTGANLSCSDFIDASFAGANLEDANLRGANLTGAHGLERATLTNTNLRYARYGSTTRFPPGVDPKARGAVFVGPKADLSGMTLNGADLHGLTLTEANLCDMELGSANLSGTDLTRADLRGTDLTHADLGGPATCARFVDTIVPDGTTWTGCGADLPAARKKPLPRRRPAVAIPPRVETARRRSVCHDRDTTSRSTTKPVKGDEILRRYESGEREFSGVNVGGSDFPNGASLRGADLSRTRWDHATGPKLDLSSGSLERARMLQTSFHDAVLRDTNLGWSRLVEVEFHGADLRGANLSCAYTEMTRFPRANLRGAKLDGADLRGAEGLEFANLDGATFLDALYSDETILPQAFDPVARGAVRIGAGANLRGADLSHRDLRSATLDDADLQDADLEGADLMSVSLIHADLRGANLRGASFALSKSDKANCTKFEETIMPDGTIWSGCGKDLPEHYRE